MNPKTHSGTNVNGGELDLHLYFMINQICEELVIWLVRLYYKVFTYHLRGGYLQKVPWICFIFSSTPVLTSSIDVIFILYILLLCFLKFQALNQQQDCKWVWFDFFAIEGCFARPSKSESRHSNIRQNVKKEFYQCDTWSIFSDFILCSIFCTCSCCLNVPL